MNRSISPWLTFALCLTMTVIKAQVKDPAIKNYYEIEEEKTFVIAFGELCAGCTMEILDRAKKPADVTVSDKDFIWGTPVAAADPYEFHFVEKDSNKNIIFEQSTLIKVLGKTYDPVITFSDAKLNSTDPIPVNENEQLGFTVTALSGNPSVNIKSSEDVKLFFVIGKDPNNRSLDGASIIINNNILAFKWVPTNDQARARYVNFSVIAVNNLGKVTSRDIVFDVKDNNQPPRLVTFIQDEYVLNPKKPLEIDFNVIDPDNDPLLYSSDMISDGYSFTNGKLKWDLTNVNPDPLKYPVDINLVAKEATDATHIVQKKIRIKLEIDNVAPEIEKIDDLIFHEGVTITIPFVVKDESPGTLTITIEDFKNPSKLLKLLKLDPPTDNRFTFHTELPLSYTTIADDSTFRFVLKVTDAKGAKDSEVIKVTINDERDPKEVALNYQEMKRRASVILSDDQKLNDFFGDYLTKKRKRTLILGWAGIVFGVGGLISGGIDATKPKESDDVPKAFPIIGVTVAVVALFKDGFPGGGKDPAETVTTLQGRVDARKEDLQSKIASMDARLKKDDYDPDTFADEFPDFEELIGKSKVAQDSDIAKLKSDKKLHRKHTRFTRKATPSIKPQKETKKRTTPYA